MTNYLDRVRIVLIGTTHPGNVGAVARAMKNMGLSNLYLVSPADFPSERATWRAVAAADLLERAKVVETLQEAIGDCALVIGSSARNRRIPWPMVDPAACGIRVVEEAVQHPVALLFGREDRGLTNEELQRCHYHVHIPASDEYTSLNLAMAVQVVSYEVRKAWLARQGEGPGEDQWDVDYATAHEVELMLDHFETTLVDLGFHDPENPRRLMTRLRRMFQKIRPDQIEVNIVRGILTAINRKI